VGAGYKFFLKQAPILRRVLEANQMAQPDLDVAWNKWMTVTGNWLDRVYVSSWPEMHVLQRELPRDLHTDPYSLA
jgi:hypothetical protein